MESAAQFDVFIVDTVINNTDPDLKFTDTFTMEKSVLQSNLSTPSN